MTATFRNIGNVARIPDLRNKILFTLAMIVVYRLGAFIPAPGIDIDAAQLLRERADEEGGFLSFLALFSGGALTQFAIFSLGIIPYITSSIIMQVLGVVVPRIEQWQQQGAVGQRKITQWTRYMTVGIALVQSTGFAFLFHNGAGGFGGGHSSSAGGTIDFLPNFTAPRVALVVLTLTAGTALLMWIGELITQRGIGNGMSLVIFAAVLAGLPGQLALVKTNEGLDAAFGIVLLYVALTFLIVFVENGQRRIPVQFAKRQVGRRQYGGTSTYIPLKVNQSGVIPIIFASSVLYLPQLLAVVLPTDSDPENSTWGESVQNFVDDQLAQPDSIVYLVVFGLMIIGFAYFYTAITFDPVKQADNIRKQGGFVPGIRPGPQTERYLSRILSRITLPGALFIAFVALLPAFILAKMLGDNVGQGVFGFSGVSILIAAGVSLETMKQIDSQLMMRNYEGFLK
ncbi:MAG: preprotein translocase subunit SecY [Acidimicrobiia bacterium]|nr:preprotein translocase subunit SecY [Acidimicrobiia bacterium]